ncbi:hypothetical protein D3C71_1220300 [compost metagenome]
MTPVYTFGSVRCVACQEVLSRFESIRNGLIICIVYCNFSLISIERFVYFPVNRININRVGNPWVKPVVYIAICRFVLILVFLITNFDVEIEHLNRCFWVLHLFVHNENFVAADFWNE